MLYMYIYLLITNFNGLNLVMLIDWLELWLDLRFELDVKFIDWCILNTREAAHNIQVKSSILTDRRGVSVY